MASNYKSTWAKRQREQDQKDRAAERISRRTERKARAAERVASGQVGPQIAEAIAPDAEGDPASPEAAASGADGSAQPPPAGGVPSVPSRGRKPISTRLYVGNLSFDTDTAAVTTLFSTLGEVLDVHVSMDPESGRPRGFAFVTMGSAAEAQKAIEQLDGQTVQGRPLRVNAAEERDSRPRVHRPAGRNRF